MPNAEKVSTQKDDKTRNFMIDILKIVAIIFVITTHTSNFDGNSFITIQDVCVPLFLVITGYNFSKSIFLKQQTIKEYYSVKNLWTKIKRFLIPYFVLVAIEFVLLIITKQLTISNCLQFLYGGLGDGSYYTPLLLQIIFLFPLIFVLIKKNKNYIFLFFAINLVFEVVINLICPQTPVTMQIYRIIIFRQLFYIAGGCYIFFYKGKLEDILSIVFIAVGLLFYILADLNLYNPIIFKTWPGTTLPFGLLAIGLVYIFTKKIQINHYSTTIASFSNATFHIFLTQQIYFWLNYIYNFSIFSPLFNITICCAIGTVWYLIEKSIAKVLKAKKWK